VRGKRDTRRQCAHARHLAPRPRASDARPGAHEHFDPSLGMGPGLGLRPIREWKMYNMATARAPRQGDLSCAKGDTEGAAARHRDQSHYRDTEFDIRWPIAPSEVFRWKLGVRTQRVTAELHRLLYLCEHNAHYPAPSETSPLKGLGRTTRFRYAMCVHSRLGTLRERLSFLYLSEAWEQGEVND